MVAGTVAACSPDGDAAAARASADAGGEAAPAAPYSLDALTSARIGSNSARPDFQRAAAPIDLRDGPFERVTLVVDLDTTCFPFERWEDDPPPTGHNWPASCDAFDRNFEIVLDEPRSAADPPGLELVRAITPFGGPMRVEADVTEVANGLPGPHELGVRITTWSDASGQVTGADGGWTVSARLDVVPGRPPAGVLAVVPLFYDSVTVPGIEPLEFETPPGTVFTRLEYRATGHGGARGAPGCGLAAAEEFCRRAHAIFADEALVGDVDPWRDDCERLCTVARQPSASGGFDYCVENPTGDIGSVRASRSNWCPGSVTPPFTWDLDALRTAGPHSFRWQLTDVAPGGSWRISVNFFAFGAAIEPGAAR